MNKLSVSRRAAVVRALVEGNSIRSVCRITDTAKGTVMRLLADVGTVCAEYQREALIDLPCNEIQCDEMWAFCYSKQKNVPADKQGEFGYGDVWIFSAIDAQSKLVPTWLVGLRDGGHAYEFMSDLAARLARRVQMTTDGHRMYLSAVEDTFGAGIDYAMLIKLYGGAEPEEQRRYSPAECIGVDTRVIQGNPDKARISTSYIERQNLTLRMASRRFTRLTNGFSKKVANLEHAVALHYMYYNFARPHKTLGNMTTPAMAAGVSDHVWSMEEIVRLLPDSN